MKHIVTYSIVFAASMALSGVGGFLLTPAKDAPKQPNNAVETPSTTTTSSSTVDDTSIDDEPTFIPIELTPVDYLIDGLLNMKSLKANGNIDIIYTDYNVSLTDFDLYLTLETFSDIAVNLNTNLKYHEGYTPLNVSFLDDTIYCSVLGNDIKLQTSDFSDIGDILNSFGIEMQTPAIFEGVSLDSIMEEMKTMQYSPLVEGGYEFTVCLFGLNIYLTCDNDYSLTSLDVSGELEGINLNVSLNTVIKNEIIDYVISPETEDRIYQPFNSFFPFIRSIGELANQTQFGISLTGTVQNINKEDALTIDGDLQFDLNNNSGEGKLSIVDRSDKTYVTETDEVYPTHNIEINVDNEDMKFKYNEGMYGKFTITTLQDLITLISSFLESDNPIMLLLQNRLIIPDLSSSIISRIMNGEFELLFNDYIKKLYADESIIDIIISKDLLGIDGDLELVIGLDETQNLKYINIPNFTLGEQVINFEATLVSYNNEYQKLPAETEVRYFDFSEIQILLALGLDTAEISYFHLVGELNLPMKLLSIFDLSNICKDIGLEIEIFNDMSDLSTRVNAKLTNIPAIKGVNTSLFSGEQGKTLEVYYDNEFIYFNRIEHFKKQDKSYTCKVGTDEIMENNNIIRYLLGFGLGLSDSIMKQLMSTFTTSTPRTSPLDLSNIFNDYVYNVDAEVTDWNNETRTYKRNWYLDINVGYLANNADLKSLVVSIYGDNVSGLEGEYLQFIAVEFNINAGSGAFTCSVDLDAELIDIDPNITPDVFNTIESYVLLNEYCLNHINDSPASFSY